MKKYIVAIVSVVVILILVVVFNIRTLPTESILISGNIPLSGDLAVYGSFIKDGSMLAYSDLKSNYPNTPNIVFDWQDNRGDLKDAVSVFQKQFMSKPDIYISGLKPQTSAITNLVTQKGIPHFTWILDVTINPDSNNNIRNWVNFKKEAEVFVNYLKTKNLKKIYIVYANTVAPEAEYAGIVKPELLKMGLKSEDVVIEPYPITRTDFRDIALKIKEFNPDFIIMNGFIPHVVAMTKEFRTLGLIKEGNTIASLDMLDSASLLSKADVEGIVVATPSYLVNQNDEVDKWKTHFKQTYNREPTYHDAYAYDAIKVILEASKNLKLGANSNDWISKIRDVKTTGITGDISFDSDGSSITPMFPAIYRNGKLVPLK